MHGVSLMAVVCSNSRSKGDGYQKPLLTAASSEEESGLGGCWLEV